MEVSLGYSFDEDGLIRLQKDLNHLLNNLNDQNVKSIRTEYCRVSAKGRETIIDGSLLEMYDYDIGTSKATTTLRLRAGYNKATSNFEFSLWNSVSTTPTISLDSIGNAVFSGSVNSSQSVFVGDNIFLGQTNSTVFKGLYFNATTPTTAEAEGTTLMRSAIYTNFGSQGLIININSTNSIDMIAPNGIFIGRNNDTNTSTSLAYYLETTNFNIHNYPHVVLGDKARYNVWLGESNQSTSWNTTNIVVSRGYADASVEWNMDSYVKSIWAEQGKIIDEFASTVGWIPTVTGYVETIATSKNKRCMGVTGLTLYNNSTSSGDVQIYKHYTDVDIISNNGNRGMSSSVNFYMLFYLYDLNIINVLSTKAMQIELASSSSLGDKYRWLLGGTTSASTLTTGWNVVTRRLDQDYYYAGTFNPTIFKYARISFEVKANSTGKLATIQCFGITHQTSNGSTKLNMYPRWDDLHDGGGYRRAMATGGSLATWGMHRPSSTGITLYNLVGLTTQGSYSLYPTYGFSFGEEHLYTNAFTDNIKLEYVVKCKNDRGCLPFVGALVDVSWTSMTGQFGVYATSSRLQLNCTINSTTLTDATNNITVAYDNEFKITLWKEDPLVYSCTAGVTQITALVEKIGTTEMTTLAYTMGNAIWKNCGMAPIVSSCEPDVGSEILSFKYARR